MRLRLFTAIGCLTLGLAGMALAASTTAPTGPNGPTTRPHEGERHPLIHKALHDLREAKEALTRADHDFDGHRKAALEAADTAIKECEKCLEVDKK